MASIDVHRSSDIEISATGSQSHEDRVTAVTNTIASMRDPFGDYEELISISSRVVADGAVRSDLETAFERGSAQYQAYVKDCLISKEKEVFDTIPLLKLKDFGSAPKQATKTQTEKVSAAEERTLFTRILLVSQARNPNLRDVLSYNLTTYPLSIATAQGDMRKTSKSVMAKELEKMTGHPLLDSVEVVSPVAVVLDAMAIIKSLQTADLPETFGEYADVIFQKLLSTANYHNASRVDWVVDQYRELSIKYAEREKRVSTTGLQRVLITNADQKLPRQFTKFLAHPDNKTDLLQFLYTSMRQKELESLQVYVTNATRCSVLARRQPSEASAEIPALNSGHEEADTRLLLHGIHAAEQGSQTVIICSPDTDVLVITLPIAIAHQPAVFGFDTGTGNYRRLVNVTNMAKSLGAPICQAMPFLHAFTGCDTISAFHNKGKKKAVDVLKKDAELQDVFGSIHLTLPVPSEAQQKVENFVCRLYSAKANTVNGARYELYKNGRTSSALPPNDDALNLHLKRSVYQTRIWRDVSQQLTEVSPVGSGWCLSDGQLSLKWTERPVAQAQDLKVRISMQSTD